ncbi:hypothetical protein IJG95_01485 [Candidatus Saccharibacteria bacterium]|nr:hypothetical protein [Candidatus Saccharibacteria bacterium]
METTSTLISTNTTELTAGQAAVVGGFFGMFMTVGIALVVITIIAWWRIFEKAGEKGWKSIIPFYNIYIMFKLCGIKAWFWIILCAAFVGGILTGVNPPAELVNNDNVTWETLNAIDWGTHTPYLIGMVISCVAGIFSSALIAVKLAKAFGKSVWFSVGLFFLQFIFTLILAFGKAKYSTKNLK